MKKLQLLMMIKKKAQHSMILKVIGSGNGEEGPDYVEVKVPTLNAKNAKNFQRSLLLVRWSGGQIASGAMTVNGGGELKYPVSSFVCTCKGWLP
ncbi:hypothetical protein C5167_004169 [Papaver somniferum]|nr:hypothetical protein C5167_004169 [Papaver somniferum]